MGTFENIEDVMKGVLPWQIRYYIKYLEAKFPVVKIPFKSVSDISYYNHVLNGFIDSYGGASKIQGKVICELGPGQYLTHGAILYQMGAKMTYLIDIADLAKSHDKDVIPQNIKLDSRYEKIRKLPRPAIGEKWDTYIHKVNTFYYTGGLSDYANIPDNSVDFVFSNAVFEHVRKNILKKTMQEVCRFMKIGGIGCHIVDLRDHFGGAKNNLRFKESYWEDEIHYRMDNYTNRLSCTEITEICEEVGLSVIGLEKENYEKIPISRKNLAGEFRNMPAEDLMVRSFKIMVKKN